MSNICFSNLVYFPLISKGDHGSFSLGWGDSKCKAFPGKQVTESLENTFLSRSGGTWSTVHVPDYILFPLQIDHIIDSYDPSVIKELKEEAENKYVKFHYMYVCIRITVYSGF